MHYTLNKNFINPKVNHTPALLTKLRNHINERTQDDVPFFMMPVRLETRFMNDVEREIIPAIVNVPVMLEPKRLAWIDDLAKFKGFTDLTAHGAGLEIKTAISEFQSVLDNTEMLNPIQKHVLHGNISSIQASVNITGEWLLQNCSDAGLHLGIEQALAEANDSLTSMTDYLPDVQEDEGWIEGLADGIRSVEEVLQSIIDENETHLQSFVSEGSVVLDQSGFDVFIQNMNYLGDTLDSFRAVEEEHGADEMNRIFLWTFLKQIDEQFQTFARYIEYMRYTNEGVGSQFAHNFHAAAEALRANWVDISLPGVEPEPHLFEDAWQENAYYDSVAEMVQQTSDAVAQGGAQVQHIASLAQSGEWNQNMFDNYIGIIDNLLSVTLFEIPALTPAAGELLLSKLEPLDAQADSIITSINLLAWGDDTGGTLISEVTTRSTGIDAIRGGIGVATTLPQKQPYKFEPTQKSNELWIRVYPDEIFIHAHVEPLTDQESIAGREYWKQVTAQPHGDLAKEKAAWLAILNLYGRERAAWIIKATTQGFVSDYGQTTGSPSVAYAFHISGVFQAVSHLSLMNNYAAKLATVNWDPAAPQALQQHIDFYNPHLQHVYTTISTITALPAIYKDELVLGIATASSSYQDVLTVANGIFDPGVIQVGEMTWQWQQVQSAVNNIPVVAAWDQAVSVPAYIPPGPIIADESGWGNAPRSHVMPDRFLFALVDENTTAGNEGSHDFKHIKIGKSIPQPLKLGFDPLKAGGVDPFSHNAINNLTVIDPEIRWLFDFHAAVESGMGIYIPINDAEKVAGFDKVLVMGVKLHEFDSPPSGKTFPQYVTDEGKYLLSQLLDNHHYTRGFSILKSGTATNNTDRSSAGYNEADPYGDNSFSTETGKNRFSVTTARHLKTDGQFLSDALGINQSIVYVDNNKEKQIANSILMNRALWKGTIGAYMSEMLNHLFTQDNIKRTKNYFTDYVLACGTVPAVRIGKQPYGILATTAFSRWKWKKEFDLADENASDLLSVNVANGTYPISDLYNNVNPPLGWNNLVTEFLNDRFYGRLEKVLQILNTTWLNMAKHHVKTVDKSHGQGSAQQDFIEMLGQDALMAEVYSRFMISDLSEPDLMRIDLGLFDQRADYSLVKTKWDIYGNITNVPAEVSNLFNDFKFNLPGLGATAGFFDHGSINFHRLGAPDVTAMVNKLLRLYHTEQIKSSYRLNGPTVDEKKISPTDTLTPNKGRNYIEWLLDESLHNIWHDNQFNRMESRSLLFLLLRQSYMLTFRDAAWDLLQESGAVTFFSRLRVGNPEGIYHQQQQTDGYKKQILTKWDLLFTSLNSLRNTVSDTLKAPALLFTSSVSTPWASQQLATYLKSSNSNADIADIRNAMVQLKNKPTAELDRAMREHIDLCSYRLDAWNYGMVHKRLEEHRRSNTILPKKGIHLAAYGWVTNVKPVAKHKMSDSHLPPNLTDNSGNTYVSSGNLGFIHTPSVAHALTAALLRCGYESEKFSEDNRFAINLTSERVKMAIAVLDGVKHGQPLGAVLGYDFERGLHERHGLSLDSLIYIFRRKFPLVKDITIVNPNNDIRSSNVVDGVALLSYIRTKLAPILYEHPKSSIWDIAMGNLSAGSTNFNLVYLSFNSDLPGLPAIGTPAFRAVMAEIDRLENAMDAVADVTVAEGVFQLAKGNYQRSSAVVEAFAKGRHAVDPEIINTPRTGTHLTHRVVAAIAPVDSGAGITSPWTSIALTPRAKAEPAVNRWIAEILAAPFDAAVVTVANFPQKVGCRVVYKDESGDPQHFDLRLADLGLQPADLLALCRAGEYTNELLMRIAYHARANATNYYSAAITGIPREVPLEVKLTEKGSIPGVVASFHQLSALLGNIGELLQASRWMKPSDFISAPHTGNGNNTVAEYNLNEMQSRIGGFNSQNSNLVGVVFDSYTALFSYFNGGANITDDLSLQILKDNLHAISLFGFDIAIPDSAIEAFTPISGSAPIGTVAEELLALAERIKVEMASRRNNAIWHLTKVNAAGNDDRDNPSENLVNTYIEGVKSIFGAAFKVLPLISFDRYTGLKTQINNQLFVAPSTANDIMRHHANVPEALDEWLFGICRVQDKMEHAESIRMLVRETNNHPVKTMRPVQFPYTGGANADYWLGAAYPDTYVPAGDRLSVMVFNYAKLNQNVSVGNQYCGIAMDEWTELLPAKEETSTVTFNYDQPNAKPPQNVLLAVNPGCTDVDNLNNSTKWQLEDLIYTMLDTIDMAQIRMVEPDHFKAVPAQNGYVPGTEVFEAFKWLLPAIVGEVTPHKVKDVSGTPEHEKYRGRQDSLQQVSFEYTVNNAPPPDPGPEDIDPGTATGPTLPAFMMTNADEIDPDKIFSDTSLQQFINTEYSNTELSNLQNQLIQNIPN